MDSQNQSQENDVTGGIEVVSYITNSKGEQKPVASTTWQPVNVVNQQAWKEIEKYIDVSKEKIATGRVSCLHYYMTANQMDTALLAQYSGQSRLRVRLHLLPFFYKRMPQKVVERYAEIFQVSSDDLIQGRLMPPVYKCGDDRDQCLD